MPAPFANVLARMKKASPPDPDDHEQPVSEDDDEQPSDIDDVDEQPRKRKARSREIAAVKTMMWATGKPTHRPRRASAACCNH